MARSELDNGENFMRRPWKPGDPWTSQQEINRRRLAAAPWRSNSRIFTSRSAYLLPRGPVEAPIAGMPEPEDITGLKLLEQFLAKRKGERDGDERK